MLRHVAGVLGKRLNRFAASANHFPRLIEEYVEQIIVVQVDTARRGRGSGLRHRLRRAAGGFQRLQCARQLCLVLQAGRLRSPLRELRFFVQRRAGGDLVQLIQNRFMWPGGVGHLVRRCSFGQHVLDVQRKVDPSFFKGRPLRRDRHADTAGHMPQLVRDRVVHKQLACQQGLVSQHVDLEAHRAEAVAKPLECAVGPRLHGAGFGVGVSDKQFAYRIAHAADGRGRLVESEHGQYAPHLAHEAGHWRQRGGVGRVAEKLVQVLLDLAQRNAQFTHHRSHRLAIAHATIQLLHPRLERWRHGARAHRVQSLG